MASICGRVCLSFHLDFSLGSIPAYIRERLFRPPLANGCMRVSERCVCGGWSDHYPLKTFDVNSETRNHGNFYDSHIGWAWMKPSGQRIEVRTNQNKTCVCVCVPERIEVFTWHRSLMKCGNSLCLGGLPGRHRLWGPAASGSALSGCRHGFVSVGKDVGRRMKTSAACVVPGRAPSGPPWVERLAWIRGRAGCKTHRSADTAASFN